MTAGRPPTPIEVKRRRGTLRKDRTPAATGTLALEPSAFQPEQGPIADVLTTAGAGAWLSRVDDVLLLPCSRTRGVSAGP